MMSVTPVQSREVRDGTLVGGLPFLAFGHGPVLVVLPGLEPNNTNPTGIARRLERRRWRALARHFTVYVVRRPPGLPPGTTMTDLAAIHAQALNHEFGDPVDVLGISTGGSIALQLAADQPTALRRLILLCAACRLSDTGRRMQAVYAAHTAAGRHRAAAAALAPALAGSHAGRAALHVLMWLTGPLLAPTTPTDLLRTIAAEDTFDVTANLGRITAPTLVLGGERDGYYSPELFRRTAAGIPYSQLRPYPRKGHAATSTAPKARQEALLFLLHDR